jgi:hypothetical protein
LPQKTKNKQKQKQKKRQKKQTNGFEGNSFCAWRKAG